MQSRIRFHVKERLRRLHYIKLELQALVHKAIQKNKYVLYKNSYVSYLLLQNAQKPKFSISRHRIVCPINSSFKLVNRKYRLSRFSMNNLAKVNGISGLLKRGW